MENNESTQITEITLPMTGYIVRINKYLTIGQSRELQEILISEGNFDISTGKMDKVNPKSVFMMQDRAANFLVKEYVDISGTHHPFDTDWLNNLPVQDGTLLYEKINNIVSESNLSKDDKKN